MVKAKQNGERDAWVGTLADVRRGDVLHAFADLPEDIRLRVTVERPDVAVATRGGAGAANIGPLPLLPVEHVEVDGKTYRRGDPAAMLAFMDMQERDGSGPNLSTEQIQSWLQDVRDDRDSWDDRGY